MLFPVMAWVATIGLGPAFSAKAEKLVHSGAHRVQMPMMGLHGFVAGLSQFDGPKGEPLLREESGLLERTMSLEECSSTQPIERFDEMMMQALWQRLSSGSERAAALLEAPGPGDVLREKLSPLKPVVFNLRQSHGGRIVRPESVLELNDKDISKAIGPGTPSMVVSGKRLPM